MLTTAPDHAIRNMLKHRESAAADCRREVARLENLASLRRLDPSQCGGVQAARSALVHALTALDRVNEEAARRGI